MLDIGLASQTALANGTDQVEHDDKQEIPEYLNEAATMIKKATECESEERFDESVAFYRRAIGQKFINVFVNKIVHKVAK